MHYLQQGRNRTFVRKREASSQVAHTAGAYPSFDSIKRVGIFLLPPEWDPSPSQGTPSVISPAPIYTPGWKKAL